MCIHDGARAVFTKETCTYYRQHTKNITSIQDFSEKDILRGVEVKRDHYQLLSKNYKEYSPSADDFGNLYSQLQSDSSLKRKYCQAVRKQRSNHELWWQPIKSLKEISI